MYTHFMGNPTGITIFNAPQSLLTIPFASEWVQDPVDYVISAVEQYPLSTPSKLPFSSEQLWLLAGDPQHGACWQWNSFIHPDSGHSFIHPSREGGRITRVSRAFVYDSTVTACGLGVLGGAGIYRLRMFHWEGDSIYTVIEKMSTLLGWVLGVVDQLGDSRDPVSNSSLLSKQAL